jgi:hypothetical protein
VEDTKMPGPVENKEALEKFKSQLLEIFLQKKDAHNVKLFHAAAMVENAGDTYIRHIEQGLPMPPNMRVPANTNIIREEFTQLKKLQSTIKAKIILCDAMSSLIDDIEALRKLSTSVRNNISDQRKYPDLLREYTSKCDDIEKRLAHAAKNIDSDDVSLHKILKNINRSLPAPLVAAKKSVEIETYNDSNLTTIQSMPRRGRSPQ